MRKHRLRLKSVGLDRRTLFELRNHKRRKYLQKVKLTFSGHLPSDRQMVKFFTQAPSLKKLTLEIGIQGLNSETIMAKFAFTKKLLRKLFTLTKRIIDLEVIIFELLPVNYKILAKLNKLANLKIILMESLSNDFSCVEAFLSSPRTKKAFAKLKSLHIHLVQHQDILQKLAKFIEFSKIVAKIN